MSRQILAYFGFSPCVEAISSHSGALLGTDGVDDVVIDFEAKTATVRFDSDRTTTNAIATAPTEAGSPARSMDSSRL